MKRRFRSQKVYDYFGVINMALASGETKLDEAMELASAIIAEDNELYGSEEPTPGNPWPNGPAPGSPNPSGPTPGPKPVGGMSVFSGKKKIGTI